MIDKSHTPDRAASARATSAGRGKARAALPAFTPVPRQTSRHDGWTPQRQQGFIEALADTGSVKAAAHAVNMTPEGAYVLRRHPEAESFRKAWEAALALGVQRLEDVALERALHGIEVPVYSYGKIIGTRRVYNDRLLMFILKNRAGKRFGGGTGVRTGKDAASRSQQERLKRQWRKEWEAEQAAESAASAAEAIKTINARIMALGEHKRARSSPRTLRLQELLRASEAADEARWHARGSVLLDQREEDEED